MQNAARALLLFSLLTLPVRASAQTSPAVPARVWQAIENEISGDNSYDLIRHLTRYHAPNGSNDDFEAQNLIDGKRSVLDIYRKVRADALSSGTWYYGPVEFADMTRYFESLEKACAIAIQSK